MRGDDPRTDLLAGTNSNVRHYSGIGGGCWVLTLVFIVASSFFVFSSFDRLFKPTGGGWWKNLHVQSGLSVEVVRLSYPFLLQLFRKVTHERRWFPWRLEWALSFGRKRCCDPPLVSTSWKLLMRTWIPRGLCH